MALLTVDQLLTYLSWSIYLGIFLAVLVQAIRRPSRPHTNTALLFGSPALIIATSLATSWGLVPASGITSYVSISALLALPYLLVRLVHDIIVGSLWIRRSIEALLIIALVALWVMPPDRPMWLNIGMLLYMLATLAYVVVASVGATLEARGVTRRRLMAMSLGSLFLVLNITVSGLGLWFPEQTMMLSSVATLLGLVAGVSYLVGFAPPRWLRRSWQEPELRAFLGRAATLPRLPTTGEIVQALEQGTAASVGIPNAHIGLWDESTRLLYFDVGDQRLTLSPEEDLPTARAFRLQQSIFSRDTRYWERMKALLPYTKHTEAVLAAPITAGSRHLGVLVAYASRTPIFTDDDLALIQLLADQAAVILESRALIDQAARVQGREEATRLKEDFLSAAAHDLKTPLTTIVGRAQLMERRAQRDPTAPVDQQSLQILITEAQRLKQLVLELLEAARAEQGQLVGRRQSVDLVGLAREITAYFSTTRHPCIIEADEEVVGSYDPQRLAQLLSNLLENAIKYSPDGSTVQVLVHRNASFVHLRVIDQGIGIPPADIPQVFTRFYRGANVDDRRFPGMGLGLFICKEIVEQHGGKITIQSKVGKGSTVHVMLPYSEQHQV